MIFWSAAENGCPNSSERYRIVRTTSKSRSVSVSRIVASLI